MTKNLTINDIDEEYRNKLYIQSYESKKVIDGVKIIPLKNNVGEEGDFSELVRINDQGEMESIPGFKIAQINRSRLQKGTIKAWHIHFKQDEIWYVAPSYHMLVGLWDLREHSPTKGLTMRLSLGGGNSHLVFIPKGVAHGSANYEGEVNLFYFVNQQFNLKDPDERRIPWDTLGADFWSPQRD